MEYPYSENHIRYAIVETHISQIVVGNTILLNGVLQMVGRENIKLDTFIGRTLFGDSYQLGNKPVKKAIIQHVENEVSR